MIETESTSHFRLTLRNFSFRFSADVINKLMAALVGIVLANYLGEAENGRYNLVYSFLFIMFFISELGLAPILMRELARREDRGRDKEQADLLLNAILLKVSASLVTIGLGALLAFFLPSLIEIRSLILVAILSLLFNWGGLFGAAFEAKLRMEYPALIQLAFGLFSSAGMLFLICLQKPLWLFVVFRALLAVPETLLYLKYLKYFYSIHLRFVWVHSGFLLRESLPLMIASVSVALYLRVDQLILNAFCGKECVGIYAVAVNLVEPFWLFALAFMTALAPLLAKHFIDNTSQFRKLYFHCFRIVNSVSWPLACGGFVYSSSLISLLYKPEFAEAHIPFAILILANVFIYVGIVNNKLLIVSGNQKIELLFTFCSLLINLTLNYAFIPAYGIVGAAAASLLAYATGPVMGFCFRETRDYSRTMFTTALRPAFAAVIMAGCLYFLNISTFPGIPVGIVIYCIVLLLVGGITRQEWDLIINLKSGKQPRNIKHPDQSAKP